MNRAITKSRPDRSTTTSTTTITGLMSPMSKTLHATVSAIVKTKGSTLVPAELPYLLKQVKLTEGVYDAVLEAAKVPALAATQSTSFHYDAITPRVLVVIARTNEGDVPCATVPMLEPSMLITESLLERLAPHIGKNLNTDGITQVLSESFTVTVSGESVLEFQRACESSGRCVRSNKPWTGSVKLQYEPDAQRLRYRVKGEMGPFTGTKGEVLSDWVVSAVIRYLKKG